MESLMSLTGYRRADGQFGIRNHVLVLPTVSCVNGVVNRVCREVPETVGMPHAHGCGRGGDRDKEILFRILSGMIRHPNVGAAVVIGLGCEVSNTKKLLSYLEDLGKPLTILNVQEEGGTLTTACKAVAVAREYAASLDRIKREKMTWENLMISTECGGSDAMSGVTANVAIGAIADWLIDQGASVIFGENTEMIGAAHVLARRAENEAVAKQIIELVDRAESLTRKIKGKAAGLVISPGNMDGGMSSIAEKSMGCIIKGGTRPIVEVVDYGQPPTKTGLILQDGPGYDADSMSGLAASGSQLMFFTTGRGTPAGFPILPVIKVASNSRVYHAMKDDIDINAGSMVEGKTIENLREEIIKQMIEVINGRPTKAEANGMDVFSFMTVNPPF